MLSGGEYNHDSLLLQGSARCYVSVMHLVVVVKELLGTTRHGQSLTTSRQPVVSGDHHAWSWMCFITDTSFVNGSF